MKKNVKGKRARPSPDGGMVHVLQHDVLRAGQQRSLHRGDAVAPGARVAAHLSVPLANHPLAKRIGGELLGAADEPPGHAHTAPCKNVRSNEQVEES